MKSTSTRCWILPSCVDHLHHHHPVLEQSITSSWPHAGQPEKTINKRNIRTVEVVKTGYYKLEKKPMQLPQMLAQLAAEYRSIRI